MDTEYQAPEPENNGLLPDGSMDKEGAMAKADLFKLGKYSYKLFKKIEDDDQLESWVQAKITKAADYLASVYHYMEYEMKFSEYGHKLDNSDVLSESEKSILKNKLVEAHDKIRQLKIVEAKKANEFDDKPIRNLVAKNTKATTSGAGVHADKKKNAKAGITKHKKDVELDETFDKLKPIKTPKKSSEKQLDELDKSTLKSYTKSASQDLVPLATKLAKTTSSEKQADLGRKISNRTRGISTATDKMEEAAPSTGLTKKQKSTTVKAAKAGSDIGKPGKGFETVAKKAAKEYGSKEKGEKVAAAAMWKNKVKAVKESIEHEEKYNPYVEQGFENRKDYLNNLADEYGVDVQTVYHLARVLGSSEDFDGLVSAVEDHADSEMHEEAGPQNFGKFYDEPTDTKADTHSVSSEIEGGPQMSTQEHLAVLKVGMPALYAKIKADPALEAAITQDPAVLTKMMAGGVKEGQIDELSTKTYKAVAAKADVAKNDASDAYTNAEYYDKDDEMDVAGRKYKNHKKAAAFADRKVSHREPAFVNESIELSRIRMLSGL